MNINTIISEELNKFLNEGYVMNDERFKFKQVINNSTFSNYENFTADFDSKVTESNVVVNWSISFWLNDAGIENLIINVESLEGTFKMQLFDKHSDELKQENDKNINDYKWKYIVGDANLAKGGALYISALVFDFKNQTCSVSF